MGKFNTTSFNLFNKQNKDNVPDWMEKIAENLNVKEKEVIELEAEKRGVFAEKVQVYRPEITADPRTPDSHSSSRLEIDAKMLLSRFLVGKKYKVINSSSSNEFVSLSVEIDNVGANFSFPFELNGVKLENSPTFYVNDSEYPFSKAGMNECLSDIKKGTLKKTSIAKSIDKSYVINREEIIRRYNGSLRKATDKINQLLQEGAIVGVGSNSYGTFFNVDELFPQEEKQKSQERLAEFHFNPNMEHIATNEFKTANYLKVEASKVIREHFVDFVIENSERVGDKLQVTASVLDKQGKTTNAVFDFSIENEKVFPYPIVQYNNTFTTLEKMASSLNGADNNVIKEFTKSNDVETRINHQRILTKKDIESKLFKIVHASKVDGIVDSWIEKSLIHPINSYSFATEKTFTELLASSNLEMLSDEEIEEINKIQQNFGQDIEVDANLEKPIVDRVREVGELETTKEGKLFTANSYISKHLKNYKVASYIVKDKNSYMLNIQLLNKKTGTRHNIPLNVSFDNSKVISCVASINGKEIPLDKLLNAFSTNKVLSLYLKDKSDLKAGPIVVTESGLKNKLSTIITASRIDSVIKEWFDSGKVEKLDEEHIASQHSLQELLATVSDEDIISQEEADLIHYQKQHFGKQIKVSVDDKIEDTGVRQAEDLWSSERKMVACSEKISKLFKEYEILESNETEDKIVVSSKVKNPLNGLHLDLEFSFNMLDGKIGDISEVSDKKEVVAVNQLTNLLDKYVSDVTKEYSKNNKISKQSQETMITKNYLQNKLSSISKRDSVPTIINKFIESNLIKPINSTTYASKFTVGELISMASQDVDLSAAKEENESSIRNDYKLSIGDDNYIQDSDTRELKAKARELGEDLKDVKEKLVVATYKATSQKKITMNKCGELLNKLENSKTVKDLESISKELKSYFK